MANTPPPAFALRSCPLQSVTKFGASSAAISSQAALAKVVWGLGSWDGEVGRSRHASAAPFRPRSRRRLAPSVSAIGCAAALVARVQPCDWDTSEWILRASSHSQVQVQVC